MVSLLTEIEIAVVTAIFLFVCFSFHLFHANTLILQLSRIRKWERLPVSRCIYAGTY